MTTANMADQEATSGHSLIAQTQTMLTAQDIVEIEGALMRRTEMLDRIHVLLYKRANAETDIVRVAGVPRFTKWFARLCFRVVGGTLEYVKDERGEPLVVRNDYEDENGKYYAYTAYAKYKAPFDSGFVEASGSCSSRAPFFGIADGDIKATSDVNEDNVRKAALSDCFKQAVFTGLGLRQPTTEDLVKYGISLDASKSVDFTSGKQSTKAADTKDDTKLRDEILLLCKEIFEAGIVADDGKPYDNPAAVLKAASTSDKFSGWSRFDRISVKALGITAKNVREFRNVKLSNSTPKD